MARVGGILLHPTSLPGEDGIGDLGTPALAWLDWLGRSGSSWWQILPLGPTGYGDSPYQSGSSFAGNPLLISLGELEAEGLLVAEDFASRPAFPVDRVDYGPVIEYKERLLHQAARRFAQGETPALEAAYKEFCTAQAEWLEDYALFAGLKREHGGAAWPDWQPELAQRTPGALLAAGRRLAPEIQAGKFLQFLFDRQWSRIRRECSARAIEIIGDIPIFVAHDSADVWARPELFYLDAAGRPTVVAGVPPDLFSPTGQRWGNPLYRWDLLQKEGYRWWISRLRATLQMVDRVRLDHFLGFHAYWEIPAESSTAEKGRWVPGPGAEFFEAVRRELRDLPILAEDLGVLTQGAAALRDQFGLPGMRILQFAFDGTADHDFLPHNYPRRCVVYTGTHDNDTACGWYAQAAEGERDLCRRYLAVDGHDIAWDLIRAGWASVADAAVAPLQDTLSLGSDARMNLPGRPEGNWTWRVRSEQLTPALAARLRTFNSLYGRMRNRVSPQPDGTG